MPVSWTQITTPVGAASLWHGLAYHAGRLVAVGSTPVSIAYSDDLGTTWNATTPAATPDPFTNINGVAYLNGQWVLWGNTFNGGVIRPVVQTSPTGVTWTNQTPPEPAANGGVVHMAYGAGLYVATVNVTGSPSHLCSSPDLSTWTTRFTGAIFFDAFTALAFGNGLFVAATGASIGVGTFRLLTSPDGVTWTSRNSANPASDDYTRGIKYVDGLWRMTAYVDATGATVLETSPDGITWSNLPWTGDDPYSEFFFLDAGTGVRIGGGFAGNAVHDDTGWDHWTFDALPGTPPFGPTGMDTDGAGNYLLLYLQGQLFKGIPSAPSPPGQPSITSIVGGDGEVTVTWVPPSTGGAPTSYTVVATPGGASATVAAPTTTALITGLTNGVVYTFVVTAYNGLGAGPPSTPVTFFLNPHAAGWGLDLYATSPWGGSVKGTGIHVVSARALSTRQVEVVLSDAAQHIANTVPGDALNPATWTVQRLDTTAFLNVVSVEVVTASTYVLTCIQNFGSVMVTHRVGSTTLLDAAGGVVRSPQSADFLGILAADVVSIDAAVAVRRLAARDLANPPATTAVAVGGTLQILSGGDYASVTGAELVRKLIIRRLTTIPGEFFHLPTYGGGVKVKEPISPGDLVALKATIEAQVLKEPEVQSASASLSLSADGVLTEVVRAKLKKTGETINVEVAQPFAL